VSLKRGERVTVQYAEPSILPMTTAVPLSTLAAAMRASNALLLDLLAEIAFGDDPLDRIILAAIAQANVEGLTADAEQLRRYGTLADLPPDELRRPVSISAIASGTGMAFETVRRRVRRLSAEGLCEAGPEGVRITSRMISRAENEATLGKTYELVRGLYLRLKANGCLEELADRNMPAYSGAPPIRAAARLTFGHFLRMIAGLVRAVGDLTTALILIATLRENSEHTADLPAVVVSQGLMPDELKVPTNAATIAAVLELGESTVGRRLTRLVREGRCLKRRGGVIVATAYVQRPEIMALLQFNYTSLLRLFEPLQQLGVLAAWDAEGETAPTWQP
jgi:DNA-binding Lrp family transcriptional regulator